MRYQRFCGFLLLVLFMGMPLTAQAQQSLSVAVVDVERVLKDSEAGKNIQAQLQKQKDSFLTDLSKQEQQFRDNEKQLMDQKASLSQEEFGKKAKEFEEKLIETRQSAQNRKRVLDEAADKALNKLQNALYAAVQSIADERGYQLVLSKQNVVIGEKSLDISDEALQRLNKAVSKIDLEIAN